MRNGDDQQPDVLEDTATFNELLNKYRISLKNEFYNTIPEDIDTTEGISEQVVAEADLDALAQTVFYT